MTKLKSNERWDVETRIKGAMFPWPVACSLLDTFYSD